MVFVPTPGFDQIMRQNILPGESGGDYDALFGFSNRPGGRFAHIKPTQMTIGQMIEFTQPKGEYAQWVKSQIGRVATPTGGAQVVGTTLRDVVGKLGLDPNMRYDEATQNMIADYIYQTQGPEAWEAWGKGGGGGGGTVRASTKGGGPLAYMDGAEDFPQFDPGMTKRDRVITGLVAAGDALGSLGAGRAPTFEATDRWMQAEAERRMLAQAGTMAMNAPPKPGSDPNATIAWLTQNGHTDLVQAVASGALSAEDAMTEALQRDPLVPVDPNAPLTDEALANINTLRDDYRTDLKPFMETNLAAQNIFAAATGEGGTSDFTMAQQFAKLLDPESVVREGELAAVMSSTGSLPAFIERIKGELEMNGGKLPASTKREILRLTEQIVRVRREGAEERRGTYVRLATRAGLDPADIGLGELPMLPTAPTIADGTTTTPPPISPLFREGEQGPPVAPRGTIPLPEDF